MNGSREIQYEAEVVDLRSFSIFILSTHKESRVIPCNSDFFVLPLVLILQILTGT